MSIAFALFTPISLAVSLVLSEITGGFCQALAGKRVFWPNLVRAQERCL